jgi:hypothetical protein
MESDLLLAIREVEVIRREEFVAYSFQSPTCLYVPPSCHVFKVAAYPVAPLLTSKAALCVLLAALTVHGPAIKKARSSTQHCARSSRTQNFSSGHPQHCSCITQMPLPLELEHDQALSCQTVVPSHLSVGLQGFS